MRVLSVLAAVACLWGCLFLSPVPAQADPLWFHLEVLDLRSDSETVKVNLPMKLISTMMPHLRDEYLSAKTFEAHGGMSETELREILAAVRDAEDGSTMDLETHERTVRAVRHKEIVDIDVIPKSGRDDPVHLRIHEKVLDGLLAGDPRKIDVAVALERLGSGKAGGPPAGDLVTMTDRESRVRIWVDGKNTID